MNTHPLEFVLTDNGSEFKKHFAEELKRLHLVHYHTYPKTPKQNAHCERFNRTIQEEFVDFHVNLLLLPEKFNIKLMDYLAFYNTERVHFAFENKLSPVQYMLSLPITSLTRGQECKSGWPYTRPHQALGYETPWEYYAKANKLLPMYSSRTHT